MKKLLKSAFDTQVWHYPNIEKSRRYPANISMSMCGTLYRNDKKVMSAPICKRCLDLDGLDRNTFFTVVKSKIKLPKAIREQSFEPPEVH
jgi:hypothetical protein